MKKLLVLLFVLLILSACGGRDTSNVKTSLFGHWEDEDGNQLYVSDGKITSIDDDEKTEYKYKVLEHDEVKNYLKIERKTEEGSTVVEEFNYESDDRDTVESVVDFGTLDVNLESKGNEEMDAFAEALKNRVKEVNQGNTVEKLYKYVDDNQEPKE